MKSIALDTISATASSTRARTPATNWFAGLIDGVRQRAADRALRRQLATMDDSLLRDIGVGEDEIWRVRRGESFTPRAWE
jgi:uncharacterized protein YjiS (DUF1127 family)